VSAFSRSSTGCEDLDFPSGSMPTSSWREFRRCHQRRTQQRSRPPRLLDQGISRVTLRACRGAARLPEEDYLPVFLQACQLQGSVQLRTYGGPFRVGFGKAREGWLRVLERIGILTSRGAALRRFQELEDFPLLRGCAHLSPAFRRPLTPQIRVKAFHLEFSLERGRLVRELSIDPDDARSEIEAHLKRELASYARRWWNGLRGERYRPSSRSRKKSQFSKRSGRLAAVPRDLSNTLAEKRQYLEATTMDKERLSSELLEAKSGTLSMRSSRKGRGSRNTKLAKSRDRGMQDRPSRMQGETQSFEEDRRDARHADIKPAAFARQRENRTGLLPSSVYRTADFDQPPEGRSIARNRELNLQLEERGRKLAQSQQAITSLTERVASSATVTAAAIGGTRLVH